MPPLFNQKAMNAKQYIQLKYPTLRLSDETLKMMEDYANLKLTIHLNKNEKPEFGKWRKDIPNPNREGEFGVSPV